MTNPPPSLATDAIPTPGEVLAGKYRIDGVLGQGGMGVVLAAHHLHLDQRVAIKFLLPELGVHPDVVARFIREGRASIQIQSEHVVRVLDVATLPGGTPYMVMEFLQGQDLSAVIGQGPIGIELCVDYLLQALEAIAEAHALGMVHRDLKPANLFLVHRRDGTASIKVLDFGITKLTRPGEGANLDLTKTSAVMGSPRYMSPEQMRSTRTVDARSDIWALGVILYELLAGRPPFDATTLPDLLASILEDAPPTIALERSDVPPLLEAIVRRCLEKKPDNRFSNVAELAQALGGFSSAAGRLSAERIARVLRVQSMPTAALPQPTSTIAPTQSLAAASSAGTAGSWAGVTAKPKNANAIVIGIGAATLVAVVGTMVAGAWWVMHKASPGPSVPRALSSSFDTATSAKAAATAAASQGAPGAADGNEARFAAPTSGDATPTDSADHPAIAPSPPATNPTASAAPVTSAATARRAPPSPAVSTGSSPTAHPPKPLPPSASPGFEGRK